MEGDRDGTNTEDQHRNNLQPILKTIIIFHWKKRWLKKETKRDIKHIFPWNL